MRTTRLAVLLIVLPGAAYAQAPPPAGGEFRINEYTTGIQALPAATADVSGRYVVVWQSAGQDGSGAAIVGRRFDPAGAPLGSEFVVNTNTTADQGEPSVAATPEGGFFVTWSSQGQDGSGLGVFGRAYGAGGQPLTPELAINTTVAGDQKHARVAAIPGGFIVVWEDYDTVARRYRSLGRLYRRSGEAASPEFAINNVSHSFPAAAGLPNGAYVLAWTDGNPRQHVYVQMFDTNGPMGPPAVADTKFHGSTHDFRSRVVLVADPSGAFTVSWDTSGCFIGDGVACFWVGVEAREYDADGTARGVEFTLDEGPSLTFNSGLATSQRGVKTAAWTSTSGALMCLPPDWCNPYPSQDGSGAAVYARRFGPGAQAGEFRVNTYTTGEQSSPSVASDPSGNALVVWQSNQDGSDLGIYAQRFGGLWPAGMDVDTSGNHVLEPGESVDVRPSWRNVSGGSLAVAGTFSGLTGPTGSAPYTLTDGSGSYGTPGNGVTAPCVDCYGVAVVDATRPALHWDASVIETLTPAAQGQQIRWPLHIGKSFSDVSVSNPFYRYIETLLHRGVTAGCTPTTYCPADATTREAMAVFVLVAKEGAGYTPPACVPPNIFSDVPETSPFCRYVEELANRGVVGGCGPSQFCGSAPVTREQMAVFVLRTLDPTLDPPACAAPNLFGDLPETSPFCRWVEELARRGIVSGCGGGNYCGGAAVTREQMGVFLGVTFGLTLYGV